VAEQAGDASVLTVYRRFTDLRERLVPYLAAQAEESIRRTTPLLRCLMFDWPRDERIWDHPLQYLLGDDLLVAPVTEEGVAEWEVYLPAGDWVDVWTGTPQSGGRTVRRDVPIDIIPVYCRASAWPGLAGVFASGA
jgi:alpha-glucosidase (family GH31 glycosyl hydrolase)